MVTRAERKAAARSPEPRDLTSAEFTRTRNVAADELDEDPEPSLELPAELLDTPAHDERRSIERAARFAGMLEAASFVEDNFGTVGGIAAAELRLRVARLSAS